MMMKKKKGNDRSFSYVVICSLLCFFPGSSGEAPEICPTRSLINLALPTSCPLQVSSSMPVEVSGDFLDEALRELARDSYVAVLFYASWCPFSQKMLPIHNSLASLFPYVEHIKVEESSAMPSLFSRYGVHSFPTLIIVNKMSRVRYSGEKDVNSLLRFYQKTTGYEPVLRQSFVLEAESKTQSPAGSLKEFFSNEPYLAFSILFLIFQASMLFFPAMFSRFRAWWLVNMRRFNMRGAFENRRPWLERAAHFLNPKRLWSKLSLVKIRKIQNGATNARVWASSLTSVSS